MKSSIIIAKRLIAIAREMIAAHENFGFYNVEFDAKRGTFTVYFILDDDAVEADAMKNAESCRYAIKIKLERDRTIEVTNLENNHKSFVFTIVVHAEDEKKASCGHSIFITAAGEDEDSDEDSKENDDSEDTEDSEKDSKEDDDSGNENPVDKELVDKIRKTVSDICRKYGWSTKR